MNEAQRKEIEEGVETGMAWGEIFGGGAERMARPAEAVVVFDPPHGDGRGTKRWAGSVGSVGRAIGLFVAGLYADGGRLWQLEMSIEGGEPTRIGRAEWEERVGLK